MCEKTCPTQESVAKPLFNAIPTNVDVAWEKDFDARLESTSGGAFYIFGKNGLRMEGLFMVQILMISYMFVIVRLRP